MKFIDQNKLQRLHKENKYENIKPVVDVRIYTSFTQMEVANKKGAYIQTKA